MDALYCQSRTEEITEYGTCLHGVCHQGRCGPEQRRGNGAKTVPAVFFIIIRGEIPHFPLTGRFLCGILMVPHAGGSFFVRFRAGHHGTPVLGALSGRGRYKFMAAARISVCVLPKFKQEVPST